MLMGQQFSRVRSGIFSLVVILAAASPCLPVTKSGEQAPVSLKLVQTLSNSELATWDEPFSKHGLLAVRTGDVVQLWDTKTSTLMASLPALRKLLKAFFSVDGETFITSNREKSNGLTTKLWEAQTGHLKTTLSGLIIYYPNGSGLGDIVTLTDHDELKFWEPLTGELIKTVSAYKGSFANSKFSFDGRRVIRYGGKKGFLWDPNSGRLIAELKPPEERDILIPYYADLKLWGATFSPDSKVIATEDSLNSIELWDAGTGRLRALLQGHHSTIYSLTFSSDGRLLASASRDGTARLWEVETGSLVATLPAGKEIARRVAFNPTGTLLTVGYHTHARVWDVSTTKLRATLSRHSDVNRLVLFGTYWDAIEILLSPQGRLLLTIGNKSINVWTGTGDPVMTLAAVHSPVAIAPDEKFLATTGRDGSVQLWAIQ